MSYGRDRVLIPVTIAASAALSAEVNVGPLRIIGIQMPAAWTAGALTFQAVVSQSGATPVFGEVVDPANAAISLATPTAATYMALTTALALLGLGRIKVRSGTSGTPVNQAAQRDFFLVCVED
jgi:hypothetical protein